jgi:flagellar basal body P-ring protein FlgI
VAEAINEAKGAGTARRWTAAWCACACPPTADARVAFLADIENLDVALANGRRRGSCSTRAPARW